MSAMRAVPAILAAMLIVGCADDSQGPGAGDTRLTMPVAAAGATPLPPATPGAWTQHLQAALAGAQASSLPILAEFTGSDWCPACKLLKEEVFDTPAFKTWAAANAILFEVDFPQGPGQAADIATQNDALGKSLAVDGFPTVLVFDAQGRKLGALEGYVQGTGPERWIARFMAVAKSGRK